MQSSFSRGMNFTCKQTSINDFVTNLQESRVTNMTEVSAPFPDLSKETANFYNYISKWKIVDMQRRILIQQSEKMLWEVRKNLVFFKQQFWAKAKDFIEIYPIYQNIVVNYMARRNQDEQKLLEEQFVILQEKQKSIQLEQQQQKQAYSMFLSKRRVYEQSFFLSDQPNKLRTITSQMEKLMNLQRKQEGDDEYYWTLTAYICELQAWIYEIKEKSEELASKIKRMQVVFSRKPLSCIWEDVLAEANVSKIEPCRSKIEACTSKIESGSSKIESGSSKIQACTSKIESYRSKIESYSSNRESYSSKIGCYVNSASSKEESYEYEKQCCLQMKVIENNCEVKTQKTKTTVAESHQSPISQDQDSFGSNQSNNVTQNTVITEFNAASLQMKEEESSKENCIQMKEEESLRENTHLTGNTNVAEHPQNKLQDISNLYWRPITRDQVYFQIPEYIEPKHVYL